MKTTLRERRGIIRDRAAESGLKVLSLHHIQESDLLIAETDIGTVAEGYFVEPETDFFDEFIKPNLQ